MRLILTSDLHGHLPDIPPCDLLVIAGDLCPIEDHDILFQANWLRHEFVPWMQNVPARQTVFIAGNHDFVFAQEPELISDIEWPGIYLQDSGCTWEDLKIWGTPWANELPGWPFTASEDKLVDIYDEIPPSTQILIVHGPPHGFGDEVIGSVTGDALLVGSQALSKMLDRLPKLQLVVFGHIHEGAGSYERKGVKLINAALMNVEYEPVQPLRVVELQS